MSSVVIEMSSATEIAIKIPEKVKAIWTEIFESKSNLFRSRKLCKPASVKARGAQA